MNMHEEPLFPAEPVKLAIGEAVIVQTMWGDEPGTVVDFSHNHGWPMVSIDMLCGDTISIDVARVRPGCGEGRCLCGGCVL